MNYLKSELNLALAIGTLAVCILNLARSQTIDPNSQYYCSDAFCPEHVNQNPCSTRAANCTTTGYREFLDPETCNCCNYCFDYLKEDAICSPQSLEKPVEMCGPHLECSVDTTGQMATCKPITKRDGTDDFCLKRRADYLENKRGIAEFLPECDAHGDYAARQCLPGSLCFCSDRKGNKIFGESSSTEPQDCGCSIDVARLQEYNFEGKWPHCLPNGDYDELQCIGHHCYCRSFPNIVYYPQHMNELKCFNRSLHVYEPDLELYYIRTCELRRAELDIEVAEAAVNGTIMIVGDKPNCSPDGNYAAIQSKGDNLYCSYPDGNQIEKFEARKFSEAAADMNCHCARARYILSNTATGKPKCCTNGNYRPWQCIGSTCYCVDSLGRQDISMPNFELPDDKMTELSCYDKTDICY